MAHAMAESAIGPRPATVVGGRRLVERRSLRRPLMPSYDDDMRTIIDLPDDQLRALAEICRREKISRAEAIRRAVAEYQMRRGAAPSREAFGLWRGRRVDGLAYERRLRGEW